MLQAELISPQQQQQQQLGQDAATRVPPCPALHSCVPPHLLQAQGVELVIALTHMRLPNDLRLAQSVAGIDLVLGGHDHEPYLMHTKVGGGGGGGGGCLVGFAWLPLWLQPAAWLPGAQPNHDQTPVLLRLVDCWGIADDAVYTPCLVCLDLCIVLCSPTAPRWSRAAPTFRSSRRLTSPSPQQQGRRQLHLHLHQQQMGR